MNTKRIKRKLQKRFGADDRFFLLETALGMTGSLPRRFLKGEGWEALCRFLRAKGLELNGEELRVFAEGRKERLGTLCRYPEIVSAALAFCLAENGTKERCEAVFGSLRMLSETEGTDFAEVCSEAGRMLLSDPAYACSDRPTRAAVQGRIIREAGRKRISDTEALAVLRRKNALFRTAHGTAARAYFPLLYGTGLLFTLLASFLLPIPPAAAAFLFLPFCEASKRITDLIYARLFRAEALPRLDGEKIPEALRTLTVITVRLSDVGALCGKLERYYLCNREEEQYFGLLCDLPSSVRERDEGDEGLIREARRGIAALNRRYGNRFFLFVRGRVWDRSERCWLGWERKRGAILELIRFLDGGDTSIRETEGDLTRLAGTKYLVTLDEDTALPHSGVRKAVLTLAHPCNRAVVRDGAVREGYGVLQPRSEVSLAGARKTRFSRFLENGGGTSVYTDPAFELYQTVFGTGIFCGKGLIDLDAYRKTLDGAIPEDLLLSHDLVEGAYLRCGFLSDTVFPDAAPSTPSAASDRLHRWMRGDVQALSFAFGRVRNAEGKKRKNPLPLLSRYQLFDNLRRMLTPVSAFFALALLPFPLRLGAAAYLFLPLVPTVLHGLRFAGRRFFSGTMPALFHTLLSCLYEFSSLAQNAYLALDALFRSVWRMKVSHRHLLEWKTASESEKTGGKGKTLRTFLPSFLGGALFLALGRYAAGGAFLLYPFASLLLSVPGRKKPIPLNRRQRGTLMRYAGEAWRFFSQYVSSAEHDLPPDNVQFSPVFRIAHRTSPTNIGLYLLSCLAAADLGLIDDAELCTRAARTLCTVRDLPAYRGHLYNWYDTRSRQPLGDPYVSSVDSGNFVLSLVIFAEGLREYLPRRPALAEWITLAQMLADRADFSFLYDKKRGMLRVGVHPFREGEEEGCYDLYLSEARMTVYYAVSRGQIPVQAWRTLSRALIGHEGRVGLASWTGTMFEALLPALFLPVFRGSTSYEAVCFCLHEQKKAGMHGIWGKSESGYAAYDTDLNYQYRAFGVSSCALKPGQEKQLVYAPYAAFLALPLEPRAALSDLERMEKLGLWGVHGFYEAIDFTPGRAGKNGEIVKSHMAHHTGMILLSCLNALRENRTVSRAMRIPFLSSSVDLLCERIPVNTPILRKERARAGLKKAAAPSPRRKQAFSVSLLSNGLLRVTADSEGRLLAEAADRLLCADPFRGGRTRGICVWGKGDGECVSLSGTWKKEGDELVCRTKEKRLSCRTSVSLLPGIACMAVRITAEGAGETFTPMLTFEPVLSARGPYEAHPAFSDLSVEAEYDGRDGILYYRRRSGEREGCSLGVALGTSGAQLRFEISRDRLGLLYGEEQIRALASERFSCREGACIHPFCAVKKTSLTHGGRYDAVWLIAFGKDRAQVGAALLAAKRTDPKKRAFSFPMREEETVGLLLTALTHGGHGAPPPVRTSVTDLWSVGISGDLPILCVSLTDDAEEGTNAFRMLTRVLIAARCLWMTGTRFDLAVLMPRSGEYGHTPAAGLRAAVLASGTEGFLSRSGGIFPVSEPGLFPLIRCAARCDLPIGRDTVVQSLFLSLTRVPPSSSPIRRRDRTLTVGKSGFDRDGFLVVKGETRVPWSFPLANPTFGTLLTQNSLGYTWYRSAYGGRITPWNADALLDMTGELLLLREGGNEYDLIARSEQVRFSPGGAEYRGDGYSVLVTVDPRLPVKIVSYRGGNAQKVTLRITPVLGGREETTAKKIEGDRTVYESRMDGIPFPVFLEERRAAGEAVFLLGVDAGGKGVIPAAARAKYGSSALAVRAAEEAAAKWTHRFSALTVSSGEEKTDRLFDLFLPYQTLVCRIFARTGFYQSGGAYGFRDQLQDAVALLPYDRALTRAQILRCAAHQYREGDVMHWWHNGSPEKGVRTRCSDDLLFLPYAAAEYAAYTGDGGIWKCRVPYLDSPPLSSGERDRYEIAVQGKERESLLLHCLRALKKSAAVGQHGLPLIGTGDWNDGMNRVGEKGRGESVWLAFFRVLVIGKMLPYLEDAGLGTEAEELRREADALRKSWENAWENGFYRRGYYDDGAVLGGAESDGRIFLLPQAFAAILGAKHGKEAMQNAARVLWSERDGIFRLFSPPFPENGRDAGYIRGYCAGVRENGGQYTHGALWGIWGMCAAGMYGEAWRAFLALLPTAHAEREIYGTEPYFTAADLYGAEGMIGRGGWTLYTGSAGWTLRIFWEILLGYRRHGREFSVTPLPGMPWETLSVTLREGQTAYRITVLRGGENEWILDGEKTGNHFFFDKKEHELKITVAKSPEML